MTATAEQLDYTATLQTLSQASVERHFDPFVDIDWDNPDWAVRPSDERWIVPAEDTVGGSEWYRSLPKHEQIRVGMYRMANIMKVGLQFEQVLISGIMVHLLGMDNNRPEFRYSTHEATEECHHTQMFQEGVNRIGQPAAGGPRWFVKLAPYLPLAARPLPSVFFFGVLAGEEPIDYLQKMLLRAGADLHPMVARIMQIHVAEEARHISFAHEYLEQRSRHYGRLQRFALSLALPVIMRMLNDVIMKPTRQMQKDCNIPKEVMRDLYWKNPKSEKLLRDTFADVRSLASQMGLMNRISRRLWRWLGIDGRPARFRSEPRSAAS